MFWDTLEIVNKTIISLFFVALTFWGFGFVMGKNMQNVKFVPIKSKVETVPVESAIDRYGKYLEKYPFLNLSKDYFEKDDLYQYDIVKNPSFQSYPSIVITSGGWKIFPDTKPSSLEEVLGDYRSQKEQRRDSDMKIWDDSELVSEFRKYPYFAGYFLPDLTVDFVDKFDVNKDGLDEYVVYGSSVTMMAKDIRRVIIVDSKGKILFEYYDRSLEIVSIKDGNGFYLLSAHEEDMEVPCCARVKIKTRFVYSNNTFTPVYEQKVVYVRIGNIEDYP